MSKHNRIIPMTESDTISKAFLDTFDPKLNLTAKWEDWVDNLSDDRLVELIHYYDDPVHSGNLGVNEEYQGQMVVDIMIMSENAEDFIKMYTTMFYGFAIQSAVENKTEQKVVLDMIRNSKYLATMIWNTSHGLAKKLLEQSLPAISKAVSIELGDDAGKKFMDNMDWEQLHNNLSDIEIV